jgi:hypothetical protein
MKKLRWRKQYLIATLRITNKNYRRVAAFTQNINCLHIILAKQIVLLALKNIITDMGRIPLLLKRETCFICDLVEAVKESEVVINQLTSERNDQTVWDPIVI